MNCKNIQQPTSDIRHPTSNIQWGIEQEETERTEGFTPRRKDAKKDKVFTDRNGYDRSGRDEANGFISGRRKLVGLLSQNGKIDRPVLLLRT